MSRKVSQELAAEVDNARETQPDREIPVIVTIRPGGELTELKQKGLHVRQVFDNIPSVAGTMKASDIDQLAESEQVQIIELDSQAHAL